MPLLFSRKILPLIVFFLIAFFPLASAQAAVHVPSEGQAVTAGNSGAFSYSIPIQVPSGRNGLTPIVNLSYNSRGGNGSLGVGWGLSSGGHVMRSSKNGLDYNCEISGGSTPCFVYVLGETGSELIPRPDWCDDCFGAKFEGGFTRFKYINGTWEATDKGGTTYSFGQSIASRQEGVVGTFKWELDTVTDTYGNSNTYGYVKNQGEIYIDQIDYHGSRIDFNWDESSRPDKSTQYTAKFPVTSAYRLDSIDVYGPLERRSWTHQAVPIGLLWDNKRMFPKWYRSITFGLCDSIGKRHNNSTSSTFF